MHIWTNKIEWWWVIGEASSLHTSLLAAGIRHEGCSLHGRYNGCLFLFYNVKVYYIYNEHILKLLLTKSFNWFEGRLCCWLLLSNWSPVIWFAALALSPGCIISVSGKDVLQVEYGAMQFVLLCERLIVGPMSSSVVVLILPVGAVF